ncbi:MAG: FAD-binding domain-containing protein [Actinomycetota bacterium]
MTALPLPRPGQEAAERFVADHFGHLICDEVAASPSFRGGQAAADAALAAYDVTGYARTRNNVAPPRRRGASRLSPYIRHGLLTLGQVWDHVSGGPGKDVAKFRDELLWQEFARHWYARLGSGTARGVRRELPPAAQGRSDAVAGGWDRTMNCVATTVEELETDGWLVNQTRMWLSSQWGVRQRHRWQAGEDEFFRHLLDGSRAANRLGWQWTTGVGSSKVYGFSRWQVNKRAPELCRGCVHEHRCPIDHWPDDPDFVAVEAPSMSGTVGGGPGPGPGTVEGAATPSVVWLTAESLGADDPALAAHPDLPAVFVFDAPLLERLQLSSKRLVFLVETLAELGRDRMLEIRLGDPAAELAHWELAVTYAPVPGFARRSAAIGPVEMHPWPWLARPGEGSISSFSAWRRSIKVRR